MERRLWPRLEALGLSDFTSYHRYLRYDARARGLVTGLSRTIEAPIFTGTNDADTLAGAAIPRAVQAQDQHDQPRAETLDRLRAARDASQAQPAVR